MSLDVSSGGRPDNLLFPLREDGHHGPTSLPEPGSSDLPSSAAADTPFTTTSASASSLLSATSSSSSAYPSSSFYSSGLSPSSSSNSVSANTTAVDSPSSSPIPPDLSSSDFSHRSSIRPLPLALKTINPSLDDAKSISTDDTLRLLPQSSSLNSLPNLSSATIDGSETHQSLASATHAPPASAPASAYPSDSDSPSLSVRRTRTSIAPLVPIRRKPLNSSARTSVAASVRTSTRTSIAASLPTVEQAGLEEESEPSEEADRPQLPQLPQLPSSHHQDFFDLDSELEAEFSSLQFIAGFDTEHDTDLDNEDIDFHDLLPTPSQRFTRSGSVDSPTLYEFPKPAAPSNPSGTVLVPSSLSRASSYSPAQLASHSPSHSQSSSVSDSETIDKESFAALSDVERPETPGSAAETLPSRNTLASTPAASQTDPTATLSHHEQDLTTNPETSDQILAEYPPSIVSDDNSDSFSSTSSEDAEEQEPLEEQEEPEQPVQPEQPDVSYDQSPITSTRNSTMSLFTRKTSPPHLSLGSISNNNPSNNNTVNTNSPGNDKEDNAQRSVSPDRNSLYSVYDDDELKDTNIPTGLPTISTSISRNDVENPLPTGTTIDTNQADSPSTLKPIVKSPSSFKLGNFFGWPSASPSSTEFSDQAYSPLPSPSSPSSLQPPNTVYTHASTPATTNSPLLHQDGFGNNNSNSNKNRNLLGIISPTKSTASGDESFYYDDYLQTPPIITTGTYAASPTSAHSLSQLSQQETGQIEDMEDELKAISAELAASIRREMDLEDLVDRLQTEVNNPQPPSKRTSDYFSDSGAASNKFGDYDAAKEEIAQVQRRAEQEKAQIRLELTDKLTEERSRRRMLDQQIKVLSDRAAEVDLDALQRSNSDVSGRVKQLESTCEDLRRRLSEERGVRENFEDLLAAIKTDLQSTSNERDNLRDEVVPQLRARVEGLESQASEHGRQIYEQTKMQQELQSLKDENTGLRSAAVVAAASAVSASIESEQQLQQQHQQASLRIQQPPNNGLSRSNTVNKGQAGSTTESRESLAERLKDVEAQRDALHSALKSLLERQEFQNRENEKKIRVLEVERQRLLSASPKKAGYERDVASLRDEVSVLRRRAEEALEQKWQVEKGLGGLKMDLDRAEEEITNLRSLLQQHDILLPPAGSSRSSGSSNASSIYDTDGTAATSVGSPTPVTSASLESAYKDLQLSYAEALERIQSLESSSGAPGSVIPSDEKTTLALQRLERSLSATVAERDAARQELATQQSQLVGANGSEKALLESERSLAAQLDASARRVEELAQQVRAQLETNGKLRDRLTNMVARGEAEQLSHKERITSLESRLRSMEDQLVETQTAAEERVARHEDQVAALREAHNTQLQRLRDASGGLRALSSSSRSPVMSPRLLSSTGQFGGSGNGVIGLGIKSPMSPMFSVNGKLMPPAAASSRPSSRGSTTSAGGVSTSGAAAQAEQEQQVQVATLKVRVGELEAALTSADREMQEVVGRMNMAQIEVMQLQEELEVAGRETRRLQRTLEAEKVKGFEERFKMISRSATTG